MLLVFIVNYVYNKNTLFITPSNILFENFQIHQNLKNYYRYMPEQPYLDSTINILRHLFYHLSIHQSIFICVALLFTSLLKWYLNVVSEARFGILRMYVTDMISTWSSWHTIFSVAIG